ncbi:hypothetical protein NP493_1609g00000 [Ridgeia piscesae]|uniref:G-protein coupled receptors family 1 profile domain-containing protein n=1 Tax=Ridgeia piscesae TaxID=27915 RepID=A0AAD9JYQ1_RIDPI|nr:hypothetical protein NP493_1609g00000 [Ridgeia piscesae]
MFPLRYSSIVTPTTAKVSIAVVWTVISCLSLPPVCGWNRWTRDSTCTFSEVLPASYMVGLFAVPVVVADPTSGYNAMKGHLRSAKTMCIVLGAFYLCWCPYIILAGLTASFGSSAPRLIRVFRDVASFLVVINSGINPCIYAWRSTDFRQAYKKFMCLR